MGTIAHLQTYFLGILFVVGHPVSIAYTRGFALSGFMPLMILHPPPPPADDAPPNYMIFLFLRCCCGRLRKEHSGWIIDAFGNEWSAVRHVKESPTNAFGQVSFSEEQQDASLGAEVGRFFYR